jgi:hypothetical protein
MMAKQGESYAAVGSGEFMPEKWSSLVTANMEGSIKLFSLSLCPRKPHPLVSP